GLEAGGRVVLLHGGYRGSLVGAQPGGARRAQRAPREDVDVDRPRGRGRQPRLLVADLGRPERFLNMLRVFKVTSPMSVGSWILVASSSSATASAALEALGILRPLKWLGELTWFATGAPLATYTGALVANSAIPVWSEGRAELPWVFGASACASAGAAASLFTPAGPARRAAIAGAVAELGLTP